MSLYDFSDINEFCKLFPSYIVNIYIILKFIIYLFQTKTNYDYSLEKSLIINNIYIQTSYKYIIDITQQRKFFIYYEVFPTLFLLL